MHNSFGLRYSFEIFFLFSKNCKYWYDSKLGLQTAFSVCTHSASDLIKIVGDFQIYISSLHLFFKLQIPISKNLLKFSTWKLNIVCLKQLLVNFPKLTSPSHSHLSSWQLHNYAKKPLWCYLYSDLSFSYSSKSWPGNPIGSSYKINLCYFSSPPPLLPASLNWITASSR